ncbi:MAG: sulfite exporter TauE/SafE family protein [Verrucomicrobiota bacterium]
MTSGEILALFSSALAAGAINAVAGGGTVLTFPALLFSGTGAVEANATSTFALTMGTAGSLFGFRSHWAVIRQWVWRFVPVSILGSICGSWLVRHQGEAAFVRAVPWLLLFATVLFLLQEPLRQWRRRRAGMPADPDQAPPVAACVMMQAVVAVYGGYFGAGIGILMLSVLGFMGMKDIHSMNALKNLLAAVINGTASLYFALTGMVNWPRAMIMLAGAIPGYWLGAHFSQKIPQPAVRAFVIFTGLTISALMFWKMLAGK